MIQKKRVLIFCSSSEDVSPMYFSEMELFAKSLVQADFDVVYGGASCGLMGKLADVCLNAGGKVYGVIPKYLIKPGIVHDDLSDLIVVDKLIDRKQKMLRMSDAVVVFPGGIGTLDEVTEVLALKQLGETQVPICFYNFLDFWSPFLDYLSELKQRHMISQSFNQLFNSLDRHEDVVEYLKGITA